MNRFFLRIMASLATLLVAAHADAFEAGWMQIQTAGATPDAPTTTVALYYPTTAAPRVVAMGPFSVDAAIGSKPVDKVKALILLSHGNSGTELGHSVLAQALAWVTQLLSSHPFIVYTKWTRVPETERYYAFVRVEMDGKQQDLGELLVKNGYAAPNGPAPDAVPEAGRTPEDYLRTLQKVLSQAKAAGAGVWGM